MKYVIVEIVPTSKNPENGDIIQLSALKVHDFVIIDRLDLRLIEGKVMIKELLELVSYDESSFDYLLSSEEILSKFTSFVTNYSIIMMDNGYTSSYLKELNNETAYIHDLLEMESSDFIIDDIVTKYNLMPSNYIVDLMFEALVYKSNEKKDLD